MQELMQLIENRQSARGLFDPERAIPAEDMGKILEAARWTPTAHNMQNFEIVVVDDKQLLSAISEIKVPADPTFIKENYPQLSFTEDELRRKKTGIMGTMFPKSWQTPDPSLEDIENEDRGAYMAKQIVSCSAILFVLYDPSRYYQSWLRDGEYVVDGQLPRDRRPYRKLVVREESGGGSCEAAQCPGQVFHSVQYAIGLSRHTCSLLAGASRQRRFCASQWIQEIEPSIDLSLSGVPRRARSWERCCVGSGHI